MSDEKWSKCYYPGGFLMTSESVGEGHPDKMCDQVSDAVLDACLKDDPTSHVACECCTKDSMIMIFGEITTKASLDLADVIRKAIEEIGYDDSKKGFDYKTCSVLVQINKQSADILPAVEDDSTSAVNIGAGDQGLMYGYATDETPEMIPRTLQLAHDLIRKLAKVCKAPDGPFHWAGPDCKSQVTCEYVFDEEGGCVPKRVHTIVMSVQHTPDVSQEKMISDLKEHVIKAVIPPNLLDENTIYHLQSSKHFVIGGPVGDAGLTGRKIIVDSYGGWGSHGGGCFSGKDPTKVDRSGAYACRWIAKSLVSAKLARRVQVQVSYVIGHSEPLSIAVDTFGTGKKSNSELIQIIKNNFDLRPGMIIRDLKLRRPIYKRTAVYGHFGRKDEPGEAIEGFTWEKPKQLSF